MLDEFVKLLASELHDYYQYELTMIHMDSMVDFDHFDRCVWWVGQ